MTDLAKHWRSVAEKQAAREYAYARILEDQNFGKRTQCLVASKNGPHPALFRALEDCRRGYAHLELFGGALDGAVVSAEAYDRSLSSLGTWCIADQHHPGGPSDEF